MVPPEIAKGLPGHRHECDLSMAEKRSILGHLSIVGTGAEVRLSEGKSFRWAIASAAGPDRFGYGRRPPCATRSPCRGSKCVVTRRSNSDEH